MASCSSLGWNAVECILLTVQLTRGVTGWLGLSSLSFGYRLEWIHCRTGVSPQISADLTFYKFIACFSVTAQSGPEVAILFNWFHILPGRRRSSKSHVRSCSSIVAAPIGEMLNAI
ncbi:hypothetical protein C8J57DRAFT_1323842 [Mycena rebaudengoi]|nr:hypothetical protein C8J57DRAFT_1323842 [Mycena rebaudengoi]